ncbi:MAG: helix-turn-helix transcriptional regulator, partial [Clostridia bacterium]|nr:helix-turn-helix transcriptional regulator [Clostridia bacterium]
SDTFNIQSLITLFYMELSKDFKYDGERHNFWEMVYIDKGEMLCTADGDQFVLKSGEITFHKPNEYHNLKGNRTSSANVGLITFECNNAAMKFFEKKIITLNAEEKTLLSMLFEEGLSCFQIADPKNPLVQKLELVSGAPFGAEQMTKNLLELLLIKLSRHTESLELQQRINIYIDGMALPLAVKEIWDVLYAHVYDKLTVGDIAKAVGKSETSVKKLFAMYRSGGIMRYYNGLKIKEAKKLIREGRYNFAQIAEILSYDSPQYFSKCFKDQFHMTPRDFRDSILR